LAQRDWFEKISRWNKPLPCANRPAKVFIVSILIQENNLVEENIKAEVSSPQKTKDIYRKKVLARIIDDIFSDGVEMVKPII